MLRIFHNTRYDFIKPWKWAVGITIVFILIGIGDLLITGVRYSIEFTGGTLMQVDFRQPPDVGKLRGALDAAGIRGAEIQQIGNARSYNIRAQGEQAVAQQSAGAENVAREIQNVLTQTFGPDAYTVTSAELVGPKVGGELRQKAFIAVLISFLVTLIYLAVRFEWRFGVAAVIATGHDILTTLAFIKLMHLEISLEIVAAILTVIGYSLNDTIIIFDRVREDLKKYRREPLKDTLNRAINETLPRSVMTHATTAAATLALLIFAGEVIRPFAWVMLFGIVTGTFSSIYIAGPVLLWIQHRWPRQVEGQGRPGSATQKEASAPPRQRSQPVGAAASTPARSR